MDTGKFEGTLEEILRFIKLNQDTIRVESRYGEVRDKMVPAMDGRYGHTKQIFIHGVIYERMKTHYYTADAPNFTPIKHRIELKY